MGIPGIYSEIGPGDRVSLCKLAVQTLEETGRPLRLAIDISIWQFQVQAAKGGSNPAIRTLFYRLARLLGHSIQPIFVFDGPNKPVFKRNRRTGGGRSGENVVSTAMAKRLIRLFGFRAHDAPGEAEAECALLQRRGIVDAVLSEDVDTIMFGCTRTLRNWSADKEKGSGPPTHVTVYDSAVISRPDAAGLDREGMVLVALMSGGDYTPGGVPGCGIKVACQAARAGFGRSLCRIKRSDPPSALAKWRDDLKRELADNASGFFSRRNRAMAAAIPDEFPNLDDLRYYTHPVVSQDAMLERLKRTFPGPAASSAMDLQALRDFVADTFDWTGRAGAVKFIRVLAPGLLVQRMMLPAQSQGFSADSCLVRSISRRRADHPSSGKIPELRVAFLPSAVVDIDLDAELDEAPEAHGRGGLALNSDDEFGEDEAPGSTQGGGPKKVFDPSQPDMIWIPESVVRLGAPEMLKGWEAEQGSKRAAASAPKTTRTRRAKAAPSSSNTTMDRYLSVTKKTSVSAEPSVAKPGSSAAVSDLFSKQASSSLGVDIPSTRNTRSRAKEPGDVRESIDDGCSSGSKQAKPNKEGATQRTTRSAREPSLPPSRGAGTAATTATASYTIPGPGVIATDPQPRNSCSSSSNSDCSGVRTHRGADAAEEASSDPQARHRSPPPAFRRPALLSSSPPSSPESPLSPLGPASSSLKKHTGSVMLKNTFDDPGSSCLPSSSPPPVLTSPRKHISPASSETILTMMGELNISSEPPPPNQSNTTIGRVGHARSGSSVGKQKQASILGYVEPDAKQSQQRRAPEQRRKFPLPAPPQRATRGVINPTRSAVVAPSISRRPPSVIELSSDDSEPEQKPRARTRPAAAEAQSTLLHDERAQVVRKVGQAAAASTAKPAAYSDRENCDDDDEGDNYSDEDTWATAESHLPPRRPPPSHSQPREAARRNPNSDTTKLYVQRKSAVGFMTEMEVTRDEADRIIRENAALEPARRRQLYRSSDVFCIDLTDEP